LFFQCIVIFFGSILNVNLNAVHRDNLFYFDSDRKTQKPIKSRIKTENAQMSSKGSLQKKKKKKKKKNEGGYGGLSGTKKFPQNHKVVFKMQLKQF